MADFCTILLNQAYKSDILAACIQADAALKAGNAQAAAARQAGWWSFVAGVFALAGALVAGYLAYKSATAQNQEVRNQRHAREGAYVAQICAMTIDANEEVIDVLIRFGSEHRDVCYEDFEGLSFLNLSRLQEELCPANWEKHALLGSEHLDQLVTTHFCIRSFMDHINKLNSRPPSKFGARLNLSAAFNTKTQCESLMSALAPKAPPAMQAYLVPITLQSVQEPQ